MIQGVVNARSEAIVQLRVRGPAGAELDLEALIDTGYTASMTLPATALATLGLIRHSVGGAVLADGSVRQFDVYAAEVKWDGAWRPVLVPALGDEVLVGMRLLAKHELRIMVDPGGPVEISPFP
jgi:clan AA aspartic protease